MKPRTHIVTLTAVIAVILSTTAQGKDKWINLKTANFNLISNAGEKPTRDQALKLEQFRMVFSRIFPSLKPPTVPLTVYVFKDDGAFKPFKPLVNGKPANLSGYFQMGADENLIALALTEDAELTNSVIFHEYTHLLNSVTVQEWPLWIKEGLAEYYSSFEMSGDMVTLGAPISRHVFLLRERKFLPLPSLFAVRQDSPEYNEREKQGIFYAESWALCHYLMMGNNGENRKQFVKFISLLASGSAVDPAFRESFNTDYAAMEKELRSYINRSLYSVLKISLNEPGMVKDSSTRPLDEAEVEYYLGNLLMHTRRFEEAEARFRQAQALDPGLAGPYEGLGLLAYRKDRLDEAIELLQKASSLGSNNYLAHFHYAEAIQRKVQEKSTPGSPYPPELARTVKEELKASIKLMPGFPHAYAMLAYIHLATNEDLDEGLKAAQSALRLAPRDGRAALILAQIQIRKQDFEGATKTLAPWIAQTTDPNLRDSARSLQKMIDHYSDIVARDRAVTGGGEEAGNQGQPVEKPRLKRSPEESTSGKIAAPAPEPQAPPQPGQPASITGIFASMECGEEIVIVVAKDGKLLRFLVSDPVKLSFTTRVPGLKTDIGCGPVNLPAVIYFKPVQSGRGSYAGDAFRVELIRQ